MSNNTNTTAQEGDDFDKLVEELDGLTSEIMTVSRQIYNYMISHFGEEVMQTWGDRIRNFASKLQKQSLDSRDTSPLKNYLQELQTWQANISKLSQEKMQKFMAVISTFKGSGSEANVGYTYEDYVNVCRKYLGDAELGYTAPVEEAASEETDVLNLDKQLQYAPEKWKTILKELPAIEQKRLMEVVEFSEAGSSIRVVIAEKTYKLHFGKDDFGVDPTEAEALHGKEGVTYNADTPMFTRDAIVQNIEAKNHFTGNKIKAICQALCPTETFALNIELTSIHYLVTILGCQEKGRMHGDEVYGAAGKYNNKSAAQLEELAEFWNDPQTGGQKPTMALMTATLGAKKVGDPLDLPMLIQARDGKGKLSAVGRKDLQAPTRFVRNELIG